jgi:hypothetical protein
MNILAHYRGQKSANTGNQKISAMDETCGHRSGLGIPAEALQNGATMHTHANSTLARKKLADNATNITSYVKYLTDSGCVLRLRTPRRRLQSGALATVRRFDAPRPLRQIRHTFIPC